jgi:hypothetical protein
MKHLFHPAPGLAPSHDEDMRFALWYRNTLRVGCLDRSMDERLSWSFAIAEL